MRISLLKERENFDEVFKKSLTQFLVNKYNWEGELGFSFIPNTKKFIVNDLLNVFYPASFSRYKLGPLTMEFSWNPNPIKSLLQKVYIYLAVRFPLERFLSSSFFYITDKKGILEDIVIIPGNHSIRLVDTNKNICTVISKYGFDKSLLIKDAQVRIDNSNLNVPKIIELNSQAGWYKEERVIGLPLNRLNDARFKHLTLVKCHNDLALLYSSSLIKVSFGLFVENLLAEIFETITHLELSLDNEFKDYLQSIIGSISSKVTIYTDYQFCICTTHGDFQPANILCYNDDFWIIDWEYSKQRSIFYDALVYDLESRFTEHFSTRLKMFLLSLQNGAQLFSWTGQTLNQNNVHYIYTFILEDVLLKLQELSSDAIADKNNKMKPYLAEIQLFLLSINKQT